MKLKDLNRLSKKIDWNEHYSQVVVERLKVPCCNHKAAYPNLSIPEVKLFKNTLTMCLKCGWYIKIR